MKDTGSKLQLKPQAKMLLVNAPEYIADLLESEGYHITNVVEMPHVGVYDAVQLFVRNIEELNHFAPEVIPLLTPHSLFWIAYPKKSSGVKTDISRDAGWEAVKELGYEINRLVSLDSTWSSARFRHASERTKASVFGVDLPGIDRKAKTVDLPEDMKHALEEAGVLELFNTLSFTHRKEYAVAVMEAKREETRVNRILKTIEQLKAKQRKV